MVVLFDDFFNIKLIHILHIIAIFNIWINND